LCSFFQCFPPLLKTLLEKDFGPHARKGFETCGLFPVSLEKALARLPKEVEEREVESRVQMELLKTLSSMRYNPPATKHAQRPKKSQKLPAGASYTCKKKPEDEAVMQDEVTEESSSSSNSEGEEDAERKRKSLRMKEKTLPSKKKASKSKVREQQVMVESCSSCNTDSEEEEEEQRKKSAKKKGKAPLSKHKVQALLDQRFKPAKKSLSFSNMINNISEEEEEEEVGQWEEPADVTKKRSLISLLKPSGDCSDFSSDSDSEEEVRKAVSNIVVRLTKKAKLDEGECVAGSSMEKEKTEEGGPEEESGKEESSEEENAQVYLPESFVVALYQNDWYVGQVLSKEGQPEAEEGDQYVLVSFMERFHGNTFKWPNKMDVLNVVKDDILFSCQPPVPSAATSSTRVINNLSLSEKDFKIAIQKFQQTQAYYPTKKIMAFSIFLSILSRYALFDFLDNLSNEKLTFLGKVGSRQLNFKVNKFFGGIIILALKMINNPSISSDFHNVNCNVKPNGV
jgi:hypothetical protein